MNYLDIREVSDTLFSSEKYEHILVGDGSGTTLGKHCGWCCYALDNTKLGKEPERHIGGTSSGTNNFAELMPYLMAMYHIHACLTPNQQCNKLLRGDVSKVAIISDSELTVKCGNRQYERRANGSLWASLEWFEKNGYSFDWFHVSRNLRKVNQSCDAFAGMVRKALVEIAE